MPAKECVCVCGSMHLMCKCVRACVRACVHMRVTSCSCTPADFHWIELLLLAHGKSAFYSLYPKPLDGCIMIR